MPTPKQMDRMTALVGRDVPQKPGLAPDSDLPSEYWQALLDDPRADGANSQVGPSERSLRLDQIPKNLLRVGCRRCNRVIEIQKVDAVRLFGREALWKNVAERLLDNTCAERTGRHEEDGCWPAFE